MINMETRTLNHTSLKLDRRQFLRQASAGMALFSVLPRCVVEGAERLAPNQKLNVAGIGVGNQGGRDVDAVAREGHNLVALCDVDDSYAAKALVLLC